MYVSFARFQIPFRLAYCAESFVAFVVTLRLQGKTFVKFCSILTVVVEDAEAQFEYAVQFATGLTTRYGVAAPKISFVDLAWVQAANNCCRLIVVICRTENTSPPYAARVCISKTSGLYRSDGTRIR